MRVLLLTQYYAPEPVDKFTDLARGLIERGHEVEVITSFPCYPHGRTYDGHQVSWTRVETIDRVRVIRVPQFPDHSQSILRRALYYLTFALSAATLGVARSRKADVLLVYQSALPTGVAAWAISRCKRIPYVLDVADLWPESVVASGMLKNRFALALLQRVAKFVYDRAVSINVITEGYRSNLTANGVPPGKLRLIHSWPASSHLLDSAESACCDAGDRGERLTILYAGAIGPCQQLETLVEAARLLRDEACVRFLIAGDGVERIRLERLAARAGLSNIQFLGWKNPDEVACLAARCDLLLAHLKPGAMSRLSIPSKTFAYMAAGKPLLMAVEGEATDLVRRHNCGMTAPASNPQSLADAIRDFLALPIEHRVAMGKAGRRAFDEHYSRDVLIEQVIDSLLGATSPKPQQSRSQKLYRFYQRVGKRAFDVLLAILAIPLLTPLLISVALLVRWRLGAPVLFRQRRIGLGGREFYIVKFRTMTDARGADGRLLPDDRRLTRFGHFLRAASLDELPEVWNVLRGEMSLVGPRPLLVDYLPHYSADQMRRHDVRPGLTGLAQVRGRNRISWNRRLRYDAWYARHASFRLDLRILWATLGAVLRRRGIAAAGHATMPRFDEVAQAEVLSNEIHVIGAGGHGKVAIRAAQLAGLKVAGVFDDDASKEGRNLFGCTVLGAISDIRVCKRRPTLIAIGNNPLRLKLAAELNLPWATVIHPAATVDATASIGAGALILAGAVIQADATIGEHAIINNNATVEHDCQIGRGAHVASAACLGGGVEVNEGAFVGAGAVVLPFTRIGAAAKVGAGAVVLSDIPADSTAVGVPARTIERLSPSKAA